MSKFASLFDKRQAKPTGETSIDPLPTTEQTQAAGETRTLQARVLERVGAQEVTAKRSNPDYAQVKIFLPKTLHRRLKQAALTRELELSQMVEEALLKYLSTQ